MKKRRCIRECVELVLGSMEVGEEIGGLELQRRVATLNSDYTYTYPDTILRELRRNWREEFICSNTRKSIYKKIKNKE